MHDSHGTIDVRYVQTLRIQHVQSVDKARRLILKTALASLVTYRIFRATSKRRHIPWRANVAIILNPFSLKHICPDAHTDR